MDTGLLLARVVLGLLMAAHGSQKLFGWFGGYGLAGTGGFLESLGFRPGRLFAMAAGVTEFAGGLLLAFGLLVHISHGLFAQNNGVEVPLLYGAGAAAIGLIGNGAFSLDAALGLSWPAEVIWIALGLGILGGFANLAIRKTAPREAHV